MSEVTKENIDKIEKQLRARKITRTCVGVMLNVPATSICRWINAKPRRSLWDQYQEYLIKELPLHKWPITKPSGEESTYGQCAAELEITPQTFAKRLKNFGIDDPRTWVVGSRLNGKKIEFTEKPDWQGLTNRNRDHNLKKIPKPTEYERRMYGIKEDPARI